MNCIQNQIVTTNNNSTSKDLSSDKNIIMLISLITVLLLLLNVSEIVSLWLNGKSNQIYVKNLLGIKPSRIYFPIFAIFNVLILLSFAIGIFMSTIISNLFDINNFNVNISPMTCIIVLVFTCLIENLFLIINLSTKLKNGYMELKTI